MGGADSAWRSSTTPKKFGDWTTTAAVWSSSSLGQGGAVDPAVGAEGDFDGLDAEVLDVGPDDLAVLRVQAPRQDDLVPAGDPWAMRTASAAAVAPSYMEALATSMPVSWQMRVWNSKIAWSVPWLTSAW